MAKKVTSYIKLQIPAGKANPAPPVGPALGQAGVNIMAFCKEFNAATQKLEPGLPTPVARRWRSARRASPSVRRPTRSEVSGPRRGPPYG